MAHTTTAHVVTRRNVSHSGQPAHSGGYPPTNLPPGSPFNDQVKPQINPGLLDKPVMLDSDTYCHGRTAEELKAAFKAVARDLFMILEATTPPLIEQRRADREGRLYHRVFATSALTEAETTLERPYLTYPYIQMNGVGLWVDKAYFGDCALHLTPEVDRYGNAKVGISLLALHRDSHGKEITGTKLLMTGKDRAAASITCPLNTKEDHTACISNTLKMIIKCRTHHKIGCRPVVFDDEGQLSTLSERLADLATGAQFDLDDLREHRKTVKATQLKAVQIYAPAGYERIRSLSR